MDNPGPVPLGDFQITTAGPQIGAIQADLAGMLAISLQARFSPGATVGASVKAYVQTSLDQGQTWFDVACFAFTITGDLRVLNLSGLQPLTTPTVPADGALADNTVLDGPLGDRLRPRVISTGIYAQTLLSLWACVR
jgi:hypothetical protein